MSSKPAAVHTVVFYLRVSEERFERYIEMLRKHPANMAHIRFRLVHGFYSEWSPAISADHIRVLTNLEEHKIAIPEGSAIKPLTLGWIGEVDLTFNTRRHLDKPQRRIYPDEIAEEAAEVPKTPEEEAILLHRTTLKVAMSNERLLKQVSYAAWAAVVLLFLILVR